MSLGNQGRKLLTSLLPLIPFAYILFSTQLLKWSFKNRTQILSFLWSNFSVAPHITECAIVAVCSSLALPLWCSVLVLSLLTPSHTDLFIVPCMCHACCSDLWIFSLAALLPECYSQIPDWLIPASPSITCPIVSFQGDHLLLPTSHSPYTFTWLFSPRHLSLLNVL